MRLIKPLNFDWYYKPSYDECDAVTPFLKADYDRVALPHTNIELPYNNFDERLYAFTSCYQKLINISSKQKNKQVFICFEGVATYAKVYVNHQFVGEHKGGYTPFELNITDAIKYDELNQITVMVDSSERPEIPPFGNVIDYLTYGGIYREVELKFVDDIHIEDLFIQTQDVLTASPKLQTQVSVANVKKGLTLQFNLYNKRKQRISSYKRELSESLNVATQILSNITCWTLEAPELYELEVSILDESGAIIDQVTERFGFREAIFKTDGFYLNGKKIKIRGLNRHQSYAHVGYAMPKSMQAHDADLLKNELGCNLARTSHYPQSKHFLNRCDEIGLLVFTEIPGWQHISSDKEWRDLTLQHVKEMIVRDRNHPSVILWGVRINESWDDGDLYKQTNELARQLDPSRQTGGVRNFGGSQFFEDVYTYNDFVHRGHNKALDLPDEICKSKTTPYLVTEHNGHMFPTKRFDHEKKKLEHALRHLRVLDEMYASPRNSGAIGWCMFDYNTHKDFGAGDKICYHGVMDMFRIPKLAASVYGSQQDDMPVMEISSNMDIGESAGGELGSVYVFTNCDYIKLHKNGKYIGAYYPSKELFPHVPHPPILIEDLIGSQLETEESFTKENAKIIKDVLLDVARHGLEMPWHKKMKMVYTLKKTGLTMNQGMDLYGKYIGNWGGRLTTYEFEGYKNDELVKTIKKGAVTKPKLAASVTSQTLIEEKTYDVTQLSIMAQCEYGELLPFANDVVTITTEGPIEVIGESTVALIGGVRGVYLKTIGEAGNAKVTIESKYLGRQTIKLTVQKQNI